MLPIWRRKKNILAVWWLRFSTFVMIYSTAMSLVYYENTRRWMVRCYKGLIHSGGLVTFRYGTFTMLLAQLWVLLVMNTQRWMVRCYEDYLLASLWFWDFHMNCTCNATDSWGKPLLTGWLWYTYFFTIMHSTQINRGLPIRSLIRLCWWRSACIAIAWANIRTLEGETRIIKNPAQCVDD